MEILKIKPVFKEMIWGGTQLKEKYNFDIPSEKTGEVWVVSAHENGDCIIENGQFEGLPLSYVYSEYRSLFGKGNNKSFPLLVKIINARENLSIQVHPDDNYANKVENSNGKTEAWIVLDCERESKIIIGHNFTSKEEYVESIENGNLVNKLRILPIKKNDFFFIPAKTLHAICANTIIYEVQQNSNLTYRVYDYNRKDSFGNTRELHLDKANDVIQIPHISYISNQKSMKYLNLELIELINIPYFIIQKAICNGKSTIKIECEYMIAGCIEGRVLINEILLVPGSHVIIPNCFRSITVDGVGVLILSSPNNILL